MLAGGEEPNRKTGRRRFANDYLDSVTRGRRGRRGSIID
jgi:hypothetical protein